MSSLQPIPTEEFQIPHVWNKKSPRRNLDFLRGGYIGSSVFLREPRRGLLVAELLAEELLAAFAAGYHKDAEQDEDSGGNFGECELILTHHDSQ